MMMLHFFQRAIQLFDRPIRREAHDSSADSSTELGAELQPGSTSDNIATACAYRPPHIGAATCTYRRPHIGAATCTYRHSHDAATACANSSSDVGPGARSNNIATACANSSPDVGPGARSDYAATACADSPSDVGPGACANRRPHVCAVACANATAHVEALFTWTELEPYECAFFETNESPHLQANKCAISETK